jgi:hypothetical protein
MCVPRTPAPFGVSTPDACVRPRPGRRGLLAPTAASGAGLSPLRRTIPHANSRSTLYGLTLILILILIPILIPLLILILIPILLSP